MSDTQGRGFKSRPVHHNETSKVPLSTALAESAGRGGSVYTLTYTKADLPKLLAEFRDFCLVDLKLSRNTAEKHHVWEIRRFLRSLDKDLVSISIQDIREYLKRFNSKSPSTYGNVLKSLRVFYAHFLRMPQMVESFRFPPRGEGIITAPTKEMAQKFYYAIDDLPIQAFYLTTASSGLRRGELLSVTLEDVDFSQRLLVPRHAHDENTGRSKRSKFSFYNDEAELKLKDYLASRKDSDPRLFPFGDSRINRNFDRAEAKVGFRVTCQDLRIWWSDTMSDLGLADRYVDFLQGRAKRSILSRHYSDFSVEKMKARYDRCGLRILA